MPRLTPIEKEQARPEALPFFELDEERYGLVLNSTKIYAHHLPVLRAVKGLAAGYNEVTELPIALKALVRLRVATLNGCPF